jgi:hypothetical protein
MSATSQRQDMDDRAENIDARAGRQLAARGKVHHRAGRIIVSRPLQPRFPRIPEPRCAIKFVQIGSPAVTGQFVQMK